MTRQELERIESILKENGYKRAGDNDTFKQGDYYYWKSFGKEDNPYDEGRSLWVINLNIYEWFKYWDRDPMLKKHNKYASITVTYTVSRVTTEVRKELNYDLKDDAFDLKNIEDKAFGFFKYVNDYFKIEDYD